MAHCLVYFLQRILNLEDSISLEESMRLQEKDDGTIDDARSDWVTTDDEESEEEISDWATTDDEESGKGSDEESDEESVG